jgi:prolyl oligopeptidase
MIQLLTVDTPREPVIDTYHGVEVVDDYQWLEDEGSEATRRWTAAQDARTRAYLGALPFRDAVRHRCQQILKAESTSYGELSRGGSTYFALEDAAAAPAAVPGRTRRRR